MARAHPLPSLDPLVDEAYDLFAAHRLSLPLHACGCENCLPATLQEKFIRTPLRLLDLGLLTSWEESAAASVAVARRNGEMEPGAAQIDAWSTEVRALLPRIAQAVAEGTQPSNLGVENTFRTIGSAGWQDWPEAERAFVQRFAEAFFLASINRAAFARAPIGPVLALDTDGQDAAIALIILGIDEERIIELWEAAPDPNAAIHIAEARRSIRYDTETKCDTLDSVWLNDKWTGVRLGTWLTSPEIDERLEAAFFSLTGEESEAQAMREILSRALG
ncbi:MAG: hypothetical protein AAF645_29560 [Myxococcota bacterium]